MNVETIFGDFIISDQLQVDNRKLEEYCNQVKTVDRGILVTNRYGYHSSNIKDFEPIRELCKAVTASINEAKNLLGSNVDLKIKEAWVNINTKGSFMESHSHGSNFLTCVYYVKVPEKSGAICFNKSSNKYSKEYLSSVSDLTRDTYRVIPKEGQLLIFSPWLMHSVDKSESDDTRISIAFNFDIDRK